MTPTSVCLWRHREHGEGNKRWRQRRFEPSQDTGDKKMIDSNVSPEFISSWFAKLYGAASSIKNASRLWFYAYKKYKNGNSSRRTASQRRIRPAICSSRSDNFSSGISGKLPKTAFSNVIISRTADRIAVKFCMKIKKINDIFQSCVHSCSTLSITILVIIFQIIICVHVILKCDITCLHVVQRFLSCSTHILCSYYYNHIAS